MREAALGLSDELQRARAESARISSVISELEAKRNRLFGPQRRIDEAKVELSELNSKHGAELRAWIDTACAEGKPGLPERILELEALIPVLAREVEAAGGGLPEIEEELTRLGGEAGVAHRRHEELTWLGYPNAAAKLFEAAAAAKAQFETALARIDSAAATAWEAAHLQRNGAPPEAHPAFKAWEKLRSAAGQLVATLGQGVARDTETGAALLAALTEGAVEVGDLTPFMPPSRVLPSGDEHINRENAAAGPVERGNADPASTPPQESESASVALAPSPAEGIIPGPTLVPMQNMTLPPWLDTGGLSFRAPLGR